MDIALTFRPTVRIRTALLGLLIGVIGLIGPTPGARAGGQGPSLPPYVLPVRETESRIATEVRMVCVDAPTTECTAPYLDASSASTNNAGGTFRSSVCPGVTPGACRPDYIAGATLTGELIVDWPITRTPPDPDPGIDPGLSCGSSPWYKICYSGHIELNVTAPGVTVSNPIAQLDYSGGCDCFDNAADELSFGGVLVDDYWVPRTTGATCDIALEYATLVPREQLLSIGQQAFPAELCQADGNGACTVQATPVLVEPDGSLTKGCGDAPSNTFTVRFAPPNEPLAFVRKLSPVQVPLDVADADGDADADLLDGDGTTVHFNAGDNTFASGPSGLSSVSFGAAVVGDWTDDGTADLVGESGNVIRVYPGTGGGQFDDTSPIVIDSSNSTALALRDLNGDGLPDAVSTESTSSRRVIWNQTDGPISPAADTVAIGNEAEGDLDGDASFDLIDIDGNLDVSWAENTGPGTFPVASVTTLPDGLGGLFDDDRIAGTELVTLLGQDVVDGLGCAAYPSDCCTGHTDAGCDDNLCETAVCNVPGYSYCCSFDWDDNCADVADSLCSQCIDPTVPDCCLNRGGSGCEDPTCEAIVCSPFNEPQCCTGPWDDACVLEATASCIGCMYYDVECVATVNDVATADVDGDGDGDLIASVIVDQRLQHPNQKRNAVSTYWTWLPNLQVENPGSSGGNPFFDTDVEAWRVMGTAPVFEDSNPEVSRVEVADLDGDTDPDAVGAGFWFRNDSGQFAGPYALGRGIASQGCGIDGLVGYWPFTGSADDATGCDNDGTVTGAVLGSGADGSASNAYTFDGGGDVIDLGTASVLDPPLPLAVSMWVRHDCTALCRVFGNDIVSGSAYSGVWVNITSGGQVAAGLGDGLGAGSGNRRSLTGSIVLTPSTWYHVLVTFTSASSSGVSIYIDGAFDFGSMSGTGSSLGYLGNAALVGNDSSGTAPFIGDIDSLRVYARTLFSEERTALAAAVDPSVVTAGDPLLPPDEGPIFVTDLDGDSDVDVLSSGRIWEQITVPEPALGALLGSGLVALGLLARRRTRR